MLVLKNCAEFLASYSRSLREQGLIDSAMDEALDFEQDFGKSAAQNLPKSGEGSTKGKKTKGFHANNLSISFTGMTFSVSKNHLYVESTTAVSCL